MQWLIDICKEAMQQYLIDNPRYVDRGDPAAYDFTATDFTHDGVWHGLDLSAIVPENAKAVNVLVLAKSWLINKDFKLRRHGNVNIYACSRIRTMVSGFWNTHDQTVAVDNYRIVDYWSNLADSAEVSVVIKGWWF